MKESPTIRRCRGSKASSVVVMQRMQSLVGLFESRNGQASLNEIFDEIYDCKDIRDKSVLRMFDRDRKKLENLFAAQGLSIHCAEPRKYVLERGAQSPPISLRLRISGEDVQALAAGMKLSAHFLPIFSGSAERIWEQLKAGIPGEELQEKGDMFARATTVAFPVSRTSKDAFQKVVDAIFEKRVLKISQYKTYGGDEMSFHISPWFIYFKYHSWYLWGKAEEFDRSGPFRISRMRLICPAPSKTYVSPPENIDMKDYIYRDGKPGAQETSYSVRLRIHPPFAVPAMETEWYPRQVIRWEDPRKQTTAICEFYSSGLEDVARWIMRSLDSFEILDPPELREIIEQKIEIYKQRQNTLP